MTRTVRNWSIVLVASATLGFGVGASVKLATHADAVPVKPALSAYWWQQSYSDCVLMASRVIIADKTGVIASEAQMEQAAGLIRRPDGTPVYGRNAGTDWDAVPTLLAMFGVKSHEVTNQSINDLRLELAAGADVEVALNGDALWTAAGLTGQHPGTDANHAVVVETITATDITVVDSAWAGGKRETVPLAVFEAAWWGTGESSSVVAQ